MNLHISQTLFIERMIVVSMTIVLFGLVSIGGLYLWRALQKRATIKSGSPEAQLQKAKAPETSTAAMANLAEAVTGLVHHMRVEQQMIRDWVDSQAEQQRETQRTLAQLTRQTIRQ